MDWVMEYQPERYNVLMRRFGWKGGEGSEMKGFPWETCDLLYMYCIHITYMAKTSISFQYIYIHNIYISRGKLSYYFNRICNIYIYAIMCMSILCMYLSMHKD